MQIEELIVSVSPSILQECTKTCIAFLKSQGRHVEPGGVMIGTFDGRIAAIKQLLLDEQANCTPVSIQFSPAIFDKAEKLIIQHNKAWQDSWYILGTWHGHPPGYATFSSTDETTLFREQMRLRTDDPSLALTPWVHFIFANYGLDANQVKAFTMQLKSNYHLGEVRQSNDVPLKEQLAQEIADGTNLGLFVATTSNQQWQLARYHPDSFREHLNKKIPIVGMWKYFPFPRITHEFEKVFLENFCQKIGLQQFVYFRLLQHPNGIDLLAQQFKCQRISDSWNLSEVIRFTEIGIQRKENSRIRVTCQNPDLHQSVVLDLPKGVVVRDVGVALAKELKSASPPLLYTYLRSEVAVELSRRTLVDGERVELPDDLSISYILENLRDPGLPIYFQTLEVTEAKLFELRTQRFRQLGHDIARVQRAKVLIGGVGLLGSEVAANLATLGIGTLYVIDNGFVDWLNIYRQALLSKTDVYKRKVDVVKERLEEMGGVSVKILPLEVPCWTAQLDPERMKQHITLLDQAVTECDLVIGAFDKFSPRAVLQFLCLIRHRPFLAVALEPGMGRVSLFEEPTQTGCYCCGLPDPREGKWYDGGACTLATLEGQRTTAALATKLAVDRLEGRQTSIVDKLEGRQKSINEIVYNALTMTIESHWRVGSAHCSLCSSTGAVNTYQGDVAAAIIDWLFQEEPTQT
jgi:molybdopterin/thiamine biosynthesis adenylyltransferase